MNEHAPNRSGYVSAESLIRLVNWWRELGDFCQKTYEKKRMQPETFPNEGFYRREYHWMANNYRDAADELFSLIQKKAVPNRGSKVIRRK